MMTPAERESLLSDLDRSGADLLNAARALPQTCFDYSDGQERWSIAQHLEHIIVAEQGMLALLDRALRQPLDPSERGDWDGDDRSLRLRLAQSRQERIEALDVIRPTGRWTVPDLLPAFENARRRTRDFVAITTSDLRRRHIRHARFGLLDGYQWLILLVSHCDRHCAHIESIKASAGFPH